MTEENNENKQDIDLSSYFEEPEGKTSKATSFYKKTSEIKSSLARRLLNHSGGIIKTEKQANALIIILVLICLSFAFYFSYNALKGFDIPPEALENPERGLPVEED